MILVNPIIAMIHNTAANRWHPLILREDPMPGPDAPDKPTRHKSKGHHTEGFATRDEALAHIPELTENLKPHAAGPIRTALAPEDDIAWDGVGLPTVVAFYASIDGALRRAL